jgi:cell division protein FtsL
MMRFIHLIVVAALVAAAVDVYKIKFESTVQAERAAKLRVEISRERDAIAALRAEWAQLDTPARIQALAQRHLTLKPFDPMQVDTLDRLPERPPAPVPPPPSEATATIVDTDTLEPDFPTGSTADPAGAPPSVKVSP